MKRILFALIFVITASGMLSAAIQDDMQAELQKILSGAIDPISTEMAKHLGYYTGSGNISPVNTSGFPGIKAGIGLGFNTTDLLMRTLNKEIVFTNTYSNPMDSYFDTMSKGAALVPFPYDEAYFKIGIPLLPMDVGVRIGYIPSMDLKNDAATVNFGQFHLGAEGRYVLFDLLGLIKIDGRLSVDYDSGKISMSYTGNNEASTNGLVIGTNDYKIGMNMQWSGVSIGAKIMAGVNIPFIGGVFGGLGLNMNYGQVVTTATLDDTLNSLGGPYTLPTITGDTTPKPYSLMDLRLILGAQILFAYGAIEYGILNHDIAWTIIPLSIAF